MTKPLPGHHRDVISSACSWTSRPTASRHRRFRGQGALGRRTASAHRMARPGSMTTRSTSLALITTRLSPASSPPSARMVGGRSRHYVTSTAPAAARSRWPRPSLRRTARRHCSCWKTTVGGTITCSIARPGGSPRRRGTAARTTRMRATALSGALARLCSCTPRTDAAAERHILRHYLSDGRDEKVIGLPGSSSLAALACDGRRCGLRPRVPPVPLVDNLADVIGAVNLVKSLPYVAPDRAGIWGLGHGGYMMLHALTQYPEIFRCGVNTASVLGHGIVGPLGCQALRQRIRPFPYLPRR